MVKRKKLFNTKIKVLRIEKNLTQEDSAIELGINRDTVLEDIEKFAFKSALKISSVINVIVLLVYSLYSISVGHKNIDINM